MPYSIIRPTDMPAYKLALSCKSWPLLQLHIYQTAGERRRWVPIVRASHARSPVSLFLVMGSGALELFEPPFVGLGTLVRIQGILRH